MTYDGSSTANNVKFYKGSASSEVTLVATQTINKGQVEDDTVGLGIGNERGSDNSPLMGIWIMSGFTDRRVTIQAS